MPLARIVAAAPWDLCSRERRKGPRRAATVAICGLSIFALSGCQSGGTSATSETPPAKVDISVKEPGTMQPTDIALLGEKSTVTVGMTEGDALKAFPKTGGFSSEFEQNPPHFGSNYRSRFWEDSGQHGFGMILFQGHVVGAMYQEEGITLDRVNDFVRRHQSRLGTPTDQVVGKHVTYWFWEKDGQRLMICAYVKKDEAGVELTAAMGDDVVMDGIHATLARAQSAKARSDSDSPTTIEPSARRG